jgi:hypothetical protein
MPHFRKLIPTEAAAEEQRSPGARAAVTQAYDKLLAGFAFCDYRRVELHAGERRPVVRQRLQAAAKRRGLALRFRSGPGPLIFHVDAAPALVETAPAEEPVAAPLVGAVSRRPSRRRPRAAERYSDVLPRWMREGEQSGPRDKRRPRR